MHAPLAAGVSEVPAVVRVGLGMWLSFPVFFSKTAQGLVSAELSQLGESP